MKQHSPRFLARVAAVRPHIVEISAADVRARLERRDPFHLVDVREESEWAAGHLPAAEHIGKGVLERDIEARIPDAAADIVVYCGGGYRSALAADSLQRMGYTNVRSMIGGFRGWVDAGLPVVRDP
ncbi:MAG TPA: rhodanese-like domain-containing protein [Haliangiales bacterium]|nr:rhodanese-like domain-containing protein [Haliangiales bacterium]